MASPSRPLLRYHGGKWRLAPWIVSHLPRHRVYIEPYGGAASVLLRKPRAYAEIWNDLNSEVFNLFSVLRDDAASAALLRAIEMTPFHRGEFELASDPSLDPVESARRLLVRSFMGFGSSGVRGQTTGFRADSNRSGTTPAHDWVNFWPALAQIVERLKGVVIERMHALDLIAQRDREDTLFYVDPPYMWETRSTKVLGASRWHAYQHELTDADHEALLTQLLAVKGMVVLSGYATLLYDDMLAGWRRIEKQTHADGARPRTEILWINPAAAAARCAGPLFAEAS